MIDFSDQRFLDLVHAAGKDPAARGVLLDWCEEQGWIRQADDLAPRPGTWADRDCDGRLLDQDQADALIEHAIADRLPFAVPLEFIEALFGNRLRSPVLPMLPVWRDQGAAWGVKARSQYGGVHSDPLVRALQRQLIGDPVAVANPQRTPGLTPEQMSDRDAARRRTMGWDLAAMGLAPRDDR